MDNLILQKQIYDNLNNYLNGSYGLLAVYLPAINIGINTIGVYVTNITENSSNYKPHMGTITLGADFFDDVRSFGTDVFSQDNIETWDLSNGSIASLDITKRRDRTYNFTAYNSISVGAYNTGGDKIIEIFLYSLQDRAYNRVYNKILGATKFNDTETIDIPIIAFWNEDDSRYGYIRVTTISGLEGAWGLYISMKHYPFIA